MLCLMFKNREEKNYCHHSSLDSSIDIDLTCVTIGGRFSLYYAFDTYTYTQYSHLLMQE